jgi:microcystin degradation protein MlrC
MTDDSSIRWPAGDPGFARLRLDDARRVGVALIQHECNSFARHPTGIDAFEILDGARAAAALADTNTEFGGALAEVARRGATAEALLWAHALPSGPLETAAADELLARLDSALGDHLDALVLCLHGAATTVEGHSVDTLLVELARDRLGPDIAIAATLDLHANLTPRLAAGVDVLTGYRTNPHVDQAATGRRAVELLTAVTTGDLIAALATAGCPALFPDETLRLPDGILAEVLAPALAGLDRDGIVDRIVDLSVFPTQPWLDAPGIGFSVAVVTNRDRDLAEAVATALCRAVWDRRHHFEVPRLVPPAAALATAASSTRRPVIITESADAPTAGATGDGPAMIAAVLTSDEHLSVLATICDPAAVEACHQHHRDTVGEVLSITVGASLDDRWHEPVVLAARVVTVGDGAYRLSGAGYTEMSVSMGRFAVVVCATESPGRLTLVITERPAWSADPATWAHAGVDPDDFDVVLVRSCSDYLANYPTAAETAMIADVMGAASPRLERYRFERAEVVPYPVDPNAGFDLSEHLL